jgi:hypothetical protein
MTEETGKYILIVAFLLMTIIASFTSAFCYVIRTHNIMLKEDNRKLKDIIERKYENI